MPKFTVSSDPSDFDETFSDAEFFAVRSSFSSEDREKASFAGQYDTFLNVPRKNVKSKIEAVLQSRNNSNVASYKQAKNICENETGCVIIQEMIFSDFSGVIFTANPVGILNEMVIVAGRGLGDNVVDDKINTVSYFYNTDDDICCASGQDGSCSLDEEIIKKLLKTAKDIQKLYNRHMDIEYAVKNQDIYILQARPITTLSLESPIILDNSNIVESYPGVSLLLTQDFVGEVYYEIFKSCVLRISKDPVLVEAMDEYLRHMTDAANWRIYYRISSWYAVLHLLPFDKKIISIWQQMLGVSNLSVTLPQKLKVSKRTKFTVLKSFIYYLFKTPSLMEELNNSFFPKYKSYMQKIEKSSTIDELLDIYEYIKLDVLKDWDITLINDMYAFIFTALSGKKNKELISKIKNLESMKPVESIRELCCISKEFGFDSDEYKKAAKKHIEAYGDRCLSELKLETKTYRTNPELLDIYIKSQAGDTISSFSHCPKTENIFVKKAKTGIENREISRMNRSRLYGAARSIFLKIGQILKNEGKIESPDDVFYLHISDLRSASCLCFLVEQRKKQADFYKQVPNYSRLVFDKRIVNREGQIEHSQILHKKDMLFGIGTSWGKVTGEVLVIDEPEDTIDTRGKILVTKSTDPGWVLLIQNSIGIIAEKGSLLSHTAIISRELEKPAVVNVKDCTAILKTGDVVLLDADTGTVSIKR